MNAAPAPEPSLAAAPRGETYRVQTILFDSVRHACRELGVHEGDRVRCRCREGAQLLVETEHGATVALRREWARFIQLARD